MIERCEKREKYIWDGGCPSKVNENVVVTVPVTVKGFADVGEVDIHCNGPAVITRNSHHCPGKPHAISKFTVAQKIVVDIPLYCSVEADVGEGHILYVHDHDHDHDKDDDSCKESHRRDRDKDRDFKCPKCGKASCSCDCDCD